MTTAESLQAEMWLRAQEMQSLIREPEVDVLALETLLAQQMRDLQVMRSSNRLINAAPRNVRPRPASAFVPLFFR